MKTVDLRSDTVTQPTAAMREAMGKSAVVVDTSMGSAREGSEEEAENEASGVGDKAFDDVTDIKNEDFVYVY